MGLPFKPGDWVSDDGDQIARVKNVYELDGDVLLDLWMYDRDGEKLGRVSPALGGPRTFEPSCSGKYWQRIKEPAFPLRSRWVDSGNGKKTLRFWAGPRLPPADWTPTVRRRRAKPALGACPQDDRYRKALEAIAAGHNDARQLARDTLAPASAPMPKEV